MVRAPLLEAGEPLSSISMGMVQSHSPMAAMICSIWASLWVRLLRGCGFSSPSLRVCPCSTCGLAISFSSPQ